MSCTKSRGSLGGTGVRARVNPSRKPSQNRRDLPDDLGVGPVPEMLCAERAARMGINGEFALMQGAATTEIAAIPFEDKVERLFADRIRCGFGRFFDPAVNRNECGIDKQRMDWPFISPNPEYVRKREVLEASKFVK